MLKYLSWVVIIAAMAWTWKLSYSESSISMDVHATIQREVSDMIRDYIKEKRPSATEIRFQKLYTETLSPTQVRAVFKYSFVDTLSNEEDTEQVFEGQALLNKDAKSTNEESIWTIDELKADNSVLVFKKGIEVHPGSGEPSEQQQQQTEPAHSEAPSHTEGHH